MTAIRLVVAVLAMCGIFAFARCGGETESAGGSGGAPDVAPHGTICDPACHPWVDGGG